jgi:antitoxin CptB
LRDADLNRLRWQCRRGMLELDVVLTQFLDTQYSRQPDNLQAAFRALLQLPDPDLWDAIAGRVEPDDPDIRRVLAAVRGERLS